MPRRDDRALADLEAALWRDDAGSAHGLDAGRLRGPREYRQGATWLTLAAAFASLAVGLALGNALLIALGVMLGAAAGRLTDRGRTRDAARARDRGRRRGQGWRASGG